MVTVVLMAEESCAWGGYSASMSSSNVNAIAGQLPSTKFVTFEEQWLVGRTKDC